MAKITQQQISVEKQLLEKLQELRDWANQKNIDQAFDIDHMVRRQKELISRMEKSLKLIKWFGYTRDEYYELQWQPGDPEWEELTPDEDGDGCEYEEA